MLRKTINTSIICAGLMLTQSCKKNECHECHYDLNNQEVSIGEKCNDDLKDVEKNGIEIDGAIYEVHCHSH